MRTRKVFGVGVACLVALATVFAVPAPANATTYPKTTFVSVLTPQYTKPNDTNRMVLDVWNGSMNNGAPVQLWRQNGNQQQLWDIYELTEHYNGNNVYELHNNKSNKCLDMAIDGAVQDGTRVQQWTCGNQSNQKWVAERVGGYPTDAWVILKSRWNTNLCLDVTGANDSNGARIQVFTCHGRWNQRFNIS